MFTRPGKVDITMASLFRSVASPKSRKTKRREFDPKKCEVWYLFHSFGISGGSRFIMVYICIYIYIMHVLYIYVIYVYKLAQQDLSNQCNHMSLCNIEMLEPIICCI